MWTSREYLNDLEYESICSWIETVDAYISCSCDDVDEDEDCEYILCIDRTEYWLSADEMEDAYNSIKSYATDVLEEMFTLDNLFTRTREEVIGMLAEKIYNNYYYS